ncbi:hypothetical protein ACFL1G_04320 [Planctomycetota bacterium]
MFRIVSTVAFLIGFAGIALHWLFFRSKLKALYAKRRQQPPQQKLSPLYRLRKAIYILALLCFAASVVTGFFPLLILAESIFGYWSMVHITAAIVFACCLAALAAFNAELYRFDKNYCPWLKKLLKRGDLDEEVGERSEFVLKASFWLIILLAVPLIMSMVLSMFAFFGTVIQEFLAETHRYCALLLSLILIIHSYLLSFVKKNE